MSQEEGENEDMSSSWSDFKKSYTLKEVPEDFVVREIPFDKILSPLKADLETPIQVIEEEKSERDSTKSQRETNPSVLPIDKDPRVRLEELIGAETVKRLDELYGGISLKVPEEEPSSKSSDASTEPPPRSRLYIDNIDAHNRVLSFQAPTKRQDRIEMYDWIRMLFPLFLAEYKKEETSDSSEKDMGVGMKQQIQVTMNNRFSDLAPFLQSPLQDLEELCRYYNNKPDRTEIYTQHSAPKRIKDCITLALKSDVVKDDRRRIYNILASATNKRLTGKTVELDSQTVIQVSWERSQYKPRNSSIYLMVFMKRNVEHYDAMRTLSRIWRCRVSQIGTAGIKDKKAVTYQFLTVSDVPIGKLNGSRMQLEKQSMGISKSIVPVNFKLSRGRLKGNYFEIKLKNCDTKEDNAVRERALDIRSTGFVNLYGTQRVGKDEESVKPYEIGLAIMREDYFKAIDLILSGREGTEEDPQSEKIQRFRDAWKNNKGNPDIAYKSLPKDGLSRERLLLKGLRQHGVDKPLEAFKYLNETERTFWIHSYQSHVWNLMARERIKLSGTKVIDGDLVFGSGNEIIVVENASEFEFTINDLVLPLPGHGVLYPSNEIGKMYDSYLSKDSISFRKGFGDNGCLKGTYRRLLAKAEDLILSSDMPNETFARFSIPKGSYATVLIEQMING